VRKFLARERFANELNSVEVAKAKRAQAKCALVGHVWHYHDDHMAGAECLRCGLIDHDRIF
jgi:hypothetical protein